MPVSDALDDRAARVAQNQKVFDDFTARLKEMHWTWGFVTPVRGWICECANETCVEPVEMAADEYDAVRNDAASFFVAPSDAHFRPELERVIEHADRYWVVEPTGSVGDFAKPIDSRPTDAAPSERRLGASIGTGRSTHDSSAPGPSR
jgi:hypothetical protein